MGRLFTVYAALLAAFLAVACATSYTTVVTTTVMDEEANPRGQSCQQEIQQQQQMRHCMMWLQRMGRPYYEVSFLRSAVSNPRYEEEHLHECCQQLENISDKCRCEAIQHMWRQQQQQRYETEEMQQMREKLESLPRMCKLKSPSECRVSSAVFY